MPFLHERGASAHDVSSRIGVGVIAMITGDALEDRLALAAPGVNDTTFGARLGRVGGGDVNQPSAGGFQFVFELGGEDAPSLGQDRSVEPRFLADLGARRSAGPSGGSRHRFDVQLFEHDKAESSNETRARHVEVVGPDARNLAAQPRHGASLIGVATRPTFAPCQDTLSPAATLIEGLHVGKVDVLARREAESSRHAAIYADYAQGGRGGGDLDVTSDCYRPATDRSGQSDGNWVPKDLSAAAELHPAEARYFHCGPSRVQPFEADILRLKPHGVVDAGLPPVWVLRSAGEEGCVSGVEVPQGLLLAGAGDGTNEVEHHPEFRELLRLIDPCKTAACGRLILAPEISPLRQRQIVDEPGHADPLTQRLGLGIGWIEPETEAPEHGLKSIRKMEPAQ